jgi:acyl dehydratase
LALPVHDGSPAPQRSYRQSGQPGRPVLSAERPRPANVVANGVDQVLQLAGVDLGVTDYVEISQRRIVEFARVTDDHEWLHLDPVRAAAGPYGATISYGFMTLALTSRFLPELVRFDGFRVTINYGFERVRFPAPVVAGSRLRCRGYVDSVRELADCLQTNLTLTFEVEGAIKPRCIAGMLLRHYF